MAVNWRWYAADNDDPNEYTLANAATREDVIAQALPLLEPGETFHIVEAVISKAAKYDQADVIPFIRERNHETLTAGVRDMPAIAAAGGGA